MGNGKHLDLSKRTSIKNCLDEGKTAREIGAIVGLDPTNVSREVRKRRTQKQVASLNASLCAKCANRFGCNRHRACAARKKCNQRCLDCLALKSCYDYVEHKCARNDRFPFVCNGCKRRQTCPLDKWFYSPAVAEKDYRATLVGCRSGVDQTPEDFGKINDALTEGVANGQSVYHIAHSLDVNVSTTTLYRYIRNEYVTVSVHDLPKAVALKRRKRLPSTYEYAENKGIDRTGHLYRDWIVYRVKKRIVLFWEMDFLGVPHCSSRMLLVMTVPQMSFTLLYVIERPDNAKVIAVVDAIESDLGGELFRRMFEAVVTDRDSKFNDMAAFEFDGRGERRTALFFCDSGRSNQKPNVENINSQLRLYVDKKADLSTMTQEQAYELCSHLNSRILESLGASTPADAFVQAFGEEALTKLHLRRVEARLVAPKKAIK